MGGLFSGMQKSVFGDKRQPVTGIVPRIKNAGYNNFRGIIGVIVPIIALSWLPKQGEHHITVMCMWMWMFWFFLVQPVAIPCTSIIPIFILPFCGVMSTVNTANCYFNEVICLFILGSMLILLLNNSGFDRRFILWVLCSGDACQFSGKRLVFKCSTAAFILSMFSNRLIVTSTIIQYVTPILQNLQTSHGKSATEPSFDEIRYIVNNAIQTSSAIGSISILYAAYGTLLFKAIWSENPPPGQEYPDIFNFLQYSAYAFPVASVMWIANVTYHMVLINFFVRKPMSAATMNEVRTALLKEKQNIPKKVSIHEKLTVFFTIFALVIFFFRWNQYTDKGWADFRQEKTEAPTEAPEARFRSVADEAPVIKDAVVAAMFVLALHILPRSLHFTQFFTAEKKSELKDVKPESAILWWRFVDQNTNYGYFFVFGAGIALNTAVRDTGLGGTIAAHLGKDTTGYPWATGLFLVCFLTCILANIMPGPAALVCFMPMVLNMALPPAPVPWQSKLYLPALGVGVGSSLGFVFPFMYTPAYFCHHVGKVPILKMLKYSVLSVIICMLLLWFSLCFWAPYLWDPKDMGIRTVSVGGSASAPAEVTTTEAAPPAVEEI